MAAQTQLLEVSKPNLLLKGGPGGSGYAGCRPAELHVPLQTDFMTSPVSSHPPGGFISLTSHQSLPFPARVLPLPVQHQDKPASVFSNQVGMQQTPEYLLLILQIETGPHLLLK